MAQSESCLPPVLQPHSLLCMCLSRRKFLPIKPRETEGHRGHRCRERYGTAGISAPPPERDTCRLGPPSVTLCRSSWTGTFPALTRPEETPRDWVPFRQTPLSAGLGRRHVWLVSAWLGTPATQAPSGRRRPAETGESIVAGHEAKLPGQTKTNGEHRGPTASLSTQAPVS